MDIDAELGAAATVPLGPLPRTLLEQQVRASDRTYEQLAEDFESLAVTLNVASTISARHLGRLARGERSGAHPGTRRVLHALFGFPFDSLVGPPLALPLSDEPTVASGSWTADTTAATTWLEAASGWSPDSTRGEVARAMVTTAQDAAQHRLLHRTTVRSETVADELRRFYGDPRDQGCVYYDVTVNGWSATTSLLTRPEWLDIAGPIDTVQCTYVPDLMTGPTPLRLNTKAASSAARRIAEAAHSGARMVDATVYRLLSITTTDDGGLDLQMGRSTFLDYALTLDLLEGEALDAVSSGGLMPLREQILPTLEHVLDVQNRLCVGGPPVLCAIARGHSTESTEGTARTDVGDEDYLLLVQQRAPQVLNAAGRLSVIPKSFHGPMVDLREDVALSRTVHREMEEELFGRQDVDSVLGSSRLADPLHLSRLSAPMRWLINHPTAWRLEATGFGLNLLSGNYEVAGLLVIDDHRWWTKFGGAIEANWESEGIRRYSSRDYDGLLALIADTAWSNEGRFSLLQGLRRLKELGGRRVDIPSIEVKS